MYHCDYYLGLVCDVPEELARRSAYHLRPPACPDPAMDADDVYWAEQLDTKLALLLDPDEASCALGRIDASAEAQRLVDLWATVLAPDKVQCRVLRPSGVCGKLFRTGAHLVKHCQKKHPEAWREACGDRFEHAAYFNRYLADPMRPMPTLHTEPKTGAAPPAADPATYHDWDASGGGEVGALRY